MPIRLKSSELMSAAAPLHAIALQGAREVMRTKGADLEQQFHQRFLAEFQSRSNKARQTSGAFADADLSSLELSLVADEDLAETLKFNELAAKLHIEPFLDRLPAEPPLQGLDRTGEFGTQTVPGRVVGEDIAHSHGKRRLDRETRSAPDRRRNGNLVVEYARDALNDREPEPQSARQVEQAAAAALHEDVGEQHVVAGEHSTYVVQSQSQVRLPAQAVEDLENAVRDADVISCATTSTRSRGAIHAATILCTRRFCVVGMSGGP